MEAKHTTAPPTPDDVRRIVAIANPVIRNLEITYCYSRLSAAFAARTGEGANWCTFATWASRQAGRSIRGEDFVDYLELTLGERRWLLHPLATLGRRLVRRGLFQPETRLGRLTAALHTPFDAFERASDSVARGNLKVFEEIGARVRALSPRDSPDAAGLESFLDGCDPATRPRGRTTCAGPSPTTSAGGSSEPRRRAQSSPSWRISRSASTSRLACSRRSAKRSTPRTPRRGPRASRARGARPRGSGAGGR